jgi:hypothetical protein
MYTFPMRYRIALSLIMLMIIIVAWIYRIPTLMGIAGIGAVVVAMLRRS